MANQERSTALAFGLILIVLALVVLIPSIIVSVNDTESTSKIHTLNERETIKDPLSAILEDSSNNTITLTVINENTGSSETVNDLATDDNSTITLGGESITVANNGILSDGSASVTYVYPVFFGWPDGIVLLFENIAFLILVSITWGIIGVGLVMYGGAKK